MKTRNGQGNGQSELVGTRFTSEVIDENPYLQSHVSREKAKPPEDDTALHLSIEEEYGAPIEPEEELRKTKQHRLRVLYAVFATLLFVTLIGVSALYYRSTTRVEYGRSAKREVIPPPPNQSTSNSRDSRTEKAIEEAKRITTGATQETAPATATSPKLNISSDSPFSAPPQLNETAKPSPDNVTINSQPILSTDSAKPPSLDSSRTESRIRSERSSETSLYMNEKSSPPMHPPKPADTVPRDNNSRSTVEANHNFVVLPAFASMLPVRTMGAFYTLRTGALVRFELTRDMKGDGWSLRRGTILVGTSKGNDFDRAYVGIIGFIDPQTGKLVKLGGEVQGGDGGTGLKGKRRQMDSGWVRAFSRMGSAALDVTGALLSGRGRDTVIVSDGLRTRTINPVTDELSGVLGSELDRRQSRSFVEVIAGTPGYVLVTDLPSGIKGSEPTPDANSSTLAAASDVNSTRPSTGLSERELADLLANGSPEEVRSAMPRMSPEMRKIAEAVLRP